MPIIQVHIRTCRTSERHRPESLCCEKTYQRHPLVRAQQDHSQERQRKIHCIIVGECYQSFEDREHREHPGRPSCSLRLIVKCKHGERMQTSRRYGEDPQSMSRRPHQDENAIDSLRICVDSGTGELATINQNVTKRWCITIQGVARQKLSYTFTGFWRKMFV